MIECSCFVAVVVCEIETPKEILGSKEANDSTKSSEIIVLLH